MKSLIKTLKRYGFDKDHPVSKKVIATSREYQQEGHPVIDADKQAIQDLIDETITEKEEYLAQIKQTS